MTMKPFVIAAAVIIAVANLHAQKQTLSEQDKADAIRIGVKAKGKLTGLSLTDAGRAFGNALVAMSNPYVPTGGTGFSLRVYTPKTWVEQLASNAAKEYRPFTIADITEEMMDHHAWFYLECEAVPNRQPGVLAHGDYCLRMKLLSSNLATVKFALYLKFMGQFPTILRQVPEGIIFDAPADCPEPGTVFRDRVTN